MNLTKTIYTQLTDAKAIIQDIQETCKQIDSGYFQEEARYQAAVSTLEAALPRELALSLHSYLDALEESFAAAVLFIGCRGLRLNLDIFLQPANGVFLQSDFEDLHGEYRLLSIPAVQRAEERISAFGELTKTLPQELSDCMDCIGDYYAYLKTLGYKLAHYLGFRFGEAFLPRVIPGYVCSHADTNRYQRTLEDYLQVDLRSLRL